MPLYLWCHPNSLGLHEIHSNAELSLLMNRDTSNFDGRQPEEEKAELVINISDSGIVIKEEDINKLFKPFSQANKEIGNKFHQIIDLMKGQIDVFSTFG